MSPDEGDRRLVPAWSNETFRDRHPSSRSKRSAAPDELVDRHRPTRFVIEEIERRIADREMRSRDQGDRGREADDLLAIDEAAFCTSAGNQNLCKTL